MNILSASSAYFIVTCPSRKLPLTGSMCRKRYVFWFWAFCFGFTFLLKDLVGAVIITIHTNYYISKLVAVATLEKDYKSYAIVTSMR